MSQNKPDKNNSLSSDTDKNKKENTQEKESNESTSNCETQVYSRVVGYIRPTDHWNDAKKEEFDQRKTYKVEKEEK